MSEKGEVGSAFIRAIWPRAALAATEKELPADRAAEIKGRLPEDALRLIQESPGFELIPYRCVFLLNEAIFSVLGYPAAVDFWSRCLGGTCRPGALFHGMLKAVIATFPLSGYRAILMALNSAFFLLGKGCGRATEVGGDDGWLGFVWNDISQAHCDSEWERAAWEGIVGGVFRVLGDQVETRSEKITSDRRIIAWVRPGRPHGP